MKRKTAKEIPAESFRELAQSMPIDKITVKDIITDCGYSQATFYRQFQHTQNAPKRSEAFCSPEQKVCHQ